MMDMQVVTISVLKYNNFWLLIWTHSYPYLLLKIFIFWDGRSNC